MILYLVGLLMMSAVSYGGYKVLYEDHLGIIHKRQIKKILQEYGLKGDFEKGKLTCPFTNKVLTYGNVGFIRKTSFSQKPILISNSNEAIKAFSETTDEYLNQRIAGTA